MCVLLNSLEGLSVVVVMGNVAREVEVGNALLLA